MIVLFDASALINLIKGEAFELILILPGFKFLVGPTVLQECVGSDEVVDMVRKAVDDGRVGVLDDSQISGALFLSLLERFKLGPGETECLTFAVDSDAVICSDDLKARQVAASEFGEDRVTGSLGLLRDAVRSGVTTAQLAWEAYERMKQEGGFLPDIDRNFFTRVDP